MSFTYNIWKPKLIKFPFWYVWTTNRPVGLSLCYYISYLLLFFYSYWIFFYCCKNKFDRASLKSLFNSPSRNSLYLFILILLSTSTKRQTSQDWTFQASADQLSALSSQMCLQPEKNSGFRPSAHALKSVYSVWMEFEYPAALLRMRTIAFKACLMVEPRTFPNNHDWHQHYQPADDI